MNYWHSRRWFVAPNNHQKFVWFYLKYKKTISDIGRYGNVTIVAVVSIYLFYLSMPSVIKIFKRFVNQLNFLPTQICDHHVEVVVVSVLTPLNRNNVSLNLFQRSMFVHWSTRFKFCTVIVRFDPKHKIEI